MAAHAKELKAHVKKGGQIGIPKGRFKTISKHSKEDLTKAHAHMKKHGG